MSAVLIRVRSARDRATTILRPGDIIAATVREDRFHARRWIFGVTFASSYTVTWENLEQAVAHQLYEDVMSGAGSTWDVDEDVNPAKWSRKP